MSTDHDSTFTPVFDVFNTNSNTEEVLTKWVTENFPQILNKYLPALDTVEEFAVLSVGSFDGTQDMILLDYVSKKLKKDAMFLYRAIEPCEDALEAFQKSANSNFGSMSGFTFEKESSTFQDYCRKNNESSKRFDVVHFIHSIYYIDDLESALLHSYNNELKKYGIIVALIKTTEAACSVIYNSVRSQVKLPHFHDEYSLHTTDDVAKIAKKHGWKYIELERLKRKTDLTIGLEGSELGDQMLEFIFKLKVRGHVTHEGRQIIEKEILGITEDVNGRRMMNDEDGAVIILKDEL